MSEQDLKIATKNDQVVNEPLVELINVNKVFHVHTETGNKELHALTDIFLSINKGEIFSVIGESGCGKTTLGKIALRLLEANSGIVNFEKENIMQKDATEMKLFRKNAQMIFQNPFASLNPRRTLESTIKQPIMIHGTLTRAELNDRVDALLLDVGISPQYKRRYPHQFSGGQRQRINIARALASNPKLVVCDEAVAALDVSIQAQILNLLLDLKEKYNLTYLFISHDLGTVEFISDRICVMYLGKIIEFAPNEIISRRKLYHPYTKMLFDSHPVADPKQRTDKSSIVDLGDIPSALNMPSGCPFSSRCVHVSKKCQQSMPELKNYNSSDKPHYIACHWVDDAVNKQ